ncbi:MAG: RtcB family protein [Melioribacteraceae bacterium]|nr:RtcB family protein [Melioribacteraceae bacterium]
MKKIISEEKKPIKLWLDDIEESAMQQARNLANLPFTFKHVAIMPDSHLGYGMPIGGILAADETIVPNAVGVDIGCGMCALKTNYSQISRNNLEKIVNEIKRIVPVGFNWHKQAQNEQLLPVKSDKKEMPVVNEQYDKALHQAGTLGGGNHFIEIQKGNDGFIWIMIHSGSRNIGKRVAEQYNKIAVNLNKKWSSTVPKEWQLAFLPIETDEAHQYFNEMQYCVEFAFANRKLMMENVKKIFTGILTNVTFADMINIAHNYAAREKHFGQNVIVHRKGATRAYENEIGIIPGSMGTKSYIVQGLGNPESFKSCSHGAGRAMGRKEAQRKLNLKAEIELMNSQGIIHGIESVKQLDEAPTAYKDIDIVMKNQNDLVEILVELKPLAVVKG